MGALSGITFTLMLDWAPCPGLIQHCGQTGRPVQDYSNTGQTGRPVQVYSNTVAKLGALSRLIQHYGQTGRPVQDYSNTVAKLVALSRLIQHYGQTGRPVRDYFNTMARPGALSSIIPTLWPDWAHIRYTAALARPETETSSPWSPCSHEPDWARAHGYQVTSDVHTLEQLAHPL